MRFLIIISGPSIKFRESSVGGYEIGECLLPRLERGLTAWEEMAKDTLIIVSGGDGDGSRPIPSSTVMKQYLVEKGVPEKKIIEEPLATNTIENAMYCCKMMKDEQENNMLSINNVTLVTSDFHLERSRIIFEHFLARTFKEEEDAKQRSPTTSYLSAPNGVTGKRLQFFLEGEERAMNNLKKRLELYDTKKK